jgi:hypothetical protein
MSDNPVMEGLSAYIGLDNHFRQNKYYQQHMDIQRNVDARAQELHDAQMAQIQKKNDLDDAQALNFQVNQAMLNGDSVLPLEKLNPYGQKYVQDRGLVKQRVNSEGKTDLVIDGSKMSADDLANISPVYAGLDDAGRAATAISFKVLNQKLQQYSQTAAAQPGKAGYVTEKQDPELFRAANIALAPSINKGLDDEIASKRLAGITINPDNSLSFEVECFDKDGKSLGKAPVTYGRANGDPNSTVLTVPGVALQGYVESNQALGDALMAERARLGDDAPIKDQDAKIKAKAIGKMLDKIDVSDAGDNAQAQIKVAKGLVGDGAATLPEALSVAKMVRPDRQPRNPVIQAIGVGGNRKQMADVSDPLYPVLIGEPWDIRKEGGGSGGSSMDRLERQEEYRDKQASRKSVRAALTQWNKSKKAAISLAGKDDRESYLEARAQQNEDRRAYQDAMSDHYDTYGEVFTGGGKTAKGKPALTQPVVATKTKSLDEATARAFLQQAKGDNNKARALAKQAGYTF